MSIRNAILALSGLLLAACAHVPPDMPPPAPGGAAHDWRETVAGIASADMGDGRRHAVEQGLSAIGLDWKAAPFVRDDDRGANLLAPVAGDADAPLLLLGAHFDRVDTGQGATDNASGTAVVLTLAERLRERPLAHHRVAVALWDLEERGLVGAHAYVEQGREQPALYVNFDVFGWGDTIWMMSPTPDAGIATATRASADAAGIGLSVGDQYPPTDHLAFLKAGWPAVSYSLVGAAEIDGILSMYAGKPPATAPRVMEVIHSEHDTVEKVDAESAVRAIDAIEDALRRWDAMGVEGVKDA